MHTAHILRKYNPAEWGGTESAVKQLLDGLRHHSNTSTVYCPKLSAESTNDPFTEAGHHLKRYHSFLPVWGLTPEDQAQLVAVGGNLMSYDLIWKLLREKDVKVIHSHTLNRIGGIGLTVARRRKLPFVVTIHGGVYDLPDSVRKNLARPLQGGFEWGKIFGVLLKSREVLSHADAVITCNRKEATLISEKHPGKKVVIQPHGVQVSKYATDHTQGALDAFPQIAGKDVLLVLGRIDPVKNQGWVLDQIKTILAKYSNATLVFAGPSTDELFSKSLRKEVRLQGLEEKVFFTGGIVPGDPKLIGLLQYARALIVPSISETFGLVILEGWAAGTPVISSRTSGALELVKNGENGLLFNLEKPNEFHAAVDTVFTNKEMVAAMSQRGAAIVAREYDTVVLAGRIATLYRQLSEKKS